MSASAPDPGAALSDDKMQSIADTLRLSLPCEDSDALMDDLAFWDAMRGFDCVDGVNTTFVRVYAHAASVPQTLEDWSDTLGRDRGVVRGRYWYVIGPPAAIDAMTIPNDAPRVADDVGHPRRLSAEQDYLTTCSRFVASEGERYVKHPRTRGRSAEQYESLFPGVSAELHAAIDDLGRDRVRAIPDTDRWIAALSPIGPRVKAECARAYVKVRDTVKPLEDEQ